MFLIKNDYDRAFGELIEFLMTSAGSGQVLCFAPRSAKLPGNGLAAPWATNKQPTLGSKRFINETTNPTTGSTSIPEVTFNLRYPSAVPSGS